MLTCILIVDDSEGEALLVKQRLVEAGMSAAIVHMQDPQEAVAYLAGDGIYADREEYPLPEIVLLDLGMPGMDGFQVLQWIRAQPQLASVIVVTLTGDMNLKRINFSYQLSASSFLYKDGSAEEYKQFVEFFQRYIRTTANLKKTGGSPSVTGMLSIPKRFEGKPGAAPPG